MEVDFVADGVSGKASLHVAFSGQRESVECSRCGRIFKIPEALTNASGPFSPQARERTHGNLIGEAKKSTKLEEKIPAY
jgi:hypothetical protein